MVLVLVNANHAKKTFTSSNQCASLANQHKTAQNRMEGQQGQREKWEEGRKQEEGGW